MKRIAVLTSGGDSPGMNAAIRAVVRSGVSRGLDVFGVEQGFRGLVDDRVRPINARDVSGIIGRGGTILRTARCDEFLEPDGRAKAADSLREHGIEGLVVVGGDGSYRGAAALEEEQGIACVGVPGTIDNDIGGTEFTIGYDTALNTALDAIDRLRDTAESHDRIFFVEVMGRHSGYLAIMSGLAGGAEEVLVPEHPTDIDELVVKLRAFRELGKTSSIVVVAEGDDAGQALDIARMVSERSEFTDTRVTVVGHLQRGGSPTAFDRILASGMGAMAVEALLAGERGQMVASAEGGLRLRPLSDGWTLRNDFDPAYLELLHRLAQS